MAVRPVFVVGENVHNPVIVKSIEFIWLPGFSESQKKKSINSLHSSFTERYGDKKVLEISTKSENSLGVKLSAFNLKFKVHTGRIASVESVFQSSKVFEHGGPFSDLLGMSSFMAKKDSRLRSSGTLLFFNYFGMKWPLQPKTLFYDWLYINALHKNDELSRAIIEYDCFTDIEFNPDKSINCQARSAALYVSLCNLKLIDYVTLSVKNYVEVLG